MPDVNRTIALPVCDHVPGPYQGPSREEVLELRRRHVSPAVFCYYDDPIMIVEGHMQYLWDEKGTRYLDAIAGVVTVSAGHAHPKIVEAIRKQAETLIHTTTIYLHPNAASLAERLAALTPKGSQLSQTYFTNSGSEANDLAAMTARVHTGHFDIVSLRNGYHGGTQSTMGLTAMGNWKYPLPTAFAVKHAVPGYCYRCPLGLEYPSCNVKCARDVEQLIDYETAGNVAAFIAEPIQGAGGVIDPPDEYFRIVYEIIRNAGGLCISDEVQTGFGRLGSHFWGFERYGVVPDAITMAKSIANGSPLGAMTTRPEIADSMKDKLHFCTFGGNPVSTVAGLATLEVIEKDNLQENALRVGRHLKSRLQELQTTHDLVGDVRGQGLLLGVELVRHRDTKEPATQETKKVHEACRDAGLLIGRGGVHGNVLRIKPPLCITIQDADFVADCLDHVLSELN